ncbi:MAG TPA: IclR family transcriptional regulator [Pseudonocardia sp.]|nr:IclR family transcriptional regulator [Pseudonocardia sp.]
MTSKITSILLTFTEGSQHSLTEIARLAGLPISTAHRLASELASWRLLERTAGGHYRAGLPLRMIATGDAHPPTVEERAPCVLEDLTAATRCRARLGVLRGWEVSYIEKVPGPHPVTAFTPAATLPAHPTALGRALLAFAPAEVVDTAVARGLRPYTPHTVTSPDRLRRALAVTRTTRVAVTRGELDPGSCGVAVPVFGSGGDVVAALELTVRHPDEGLQPVLAALTIAARSLSRELAGGRCPQGAPEPAGTPVVAAQRRRVHDAGRARPDRAPRADETGLRHTSRAARTGRC